MDKQKLISDLETAISNIQLACKERGLSIAVSFTQYTGCRNIETHIINEPALFNEGSFPTLTEAIEAISEIPTIVEQAANQRDHYINNQKLIEEYFSNVC